MKYFEVNYLFKGQKTKTIVKSPNRSDAIAIAKVKIPGIIINVKETFSLSSNNDMYIK